MFGRTRRIVGPHPLGFIILGALIAGLPTLLAPFLPATGLAAPRLAAASGRPSTIAGNPPLVLLAALPGILSHVGGLILSGTIAAAARREVEDRPPELGTSLRHGAALFLPLLAV